MPQCTVCKNSGRKNKGMSFFMYPKDYVRRRHWLTDVGRLDLIDRPGHFRICEDHFESEFITYSNSKYRTKKNLTCEAFPSLNIPPNTGREPVLPKVVLKKANPAPQVVAPGTSAAVQQYKATQKTVTSQQYETPQQDVTLQQDVMLQQHVTSQEHVTSQKHAMLQLEVSPLPDLNNLPEPMTIIASVYAYFQNEYETLKNESDSNCDLNLLANYLSRTAEATGVSEQTVSAILAKRKREKDGSSSLRPGLRAKKKAPTETTKRKRVKRNSDHMFHIDVSPIAEEPACETADDHHADYEHHADDDHHADYEHHADGDHQTDEQQMEQGDNLIETLKVEVDEECDPAVAARLTTDPLVTEMHSAVYHLFASGCISETQGINVAIKTEPVDIIENPPSTSAAVIPQVTPAGAPFLVVKTEPLEQTGVQTQNQSFTTAQDPLAIDQVEPSSHDMEQCPGQPIDQGDPH